MAVKKTIKIKKTAKKKVATTTAKTSPKRSAKKPVRRTSVSSKKTQKQSAKKIIGIKELKAELKQLEKKFAKFGEDAVEDRADVLEDALKELVRQKKVAKTQADELYTRLDAMDD